LRHPLQPREKYKHKNISESKPLLKITESERERGFKQEFGA